MHGDEERQGDMKGLLSLSRYVFSVLLILVALAPAGASADEWLVYVDGGIESIRGAWTERSADVMFTRRSGTLVSMPYEAVDLATSTFITWHLNGRRQAPPRAKLPSPPPSGERKDSDPSCTPARVLALGSGETFDLQHGDIRERVHAACLDAPETEHSFVELGWFGRAMMSAVRLEFKVGDAVCFTEQSPPLVDEEGHRVVHLKLEGGQDYSREVIAGGLGILRPTQCDRAVEYRRLESRAIAEQRGLWGAVGERPALAAANLVVSVSGGPATFAMAPPQGSGGG